MQENQQPGQIIIPHSSGDVSKPAPDVAASSTSQVAQQSAQPVAVPTPAPIAPNVAQEPAAPIAAPAPAQPAPVEPDTWQFRTENDPTAAPSAQSLPESVSWTAAEFVAHDKGVGWYAALALGGIMAVAIIYLLTKDKITAGIVFFALLAFGVFAARKPHSEQYSLTPQGVQVGVKLYGFHDFKNFSVVNEGSTASIVFMPLKRFMPPLTIYVTAEVADKVVDFLGTYLPFAEHKADAVDSLMRRIRF